MLADNKLKLLIELVNNSTNDELIFMNGYLNGVVANLGRGQQVVSTPTVNKITIVYGTETGNSKRLATDFASKAKQKNIHAKIVGMDQYRLTDLSKEEHLLAIVSTHGDGEPPAAAKKFFDHIHNNGFKLDRLKYGVLALGDTSYPLFCKTGEDVDLQLGRLGGKRIVPLQKCDLEYEEDANTWINSVLEKLNIAETAPVAVIAPPAAKKTGKQIHEALSAEIKPVADHPPDAKNKGNPQEEKNSTTISTTQPKAVMPKLNRN